MRTTSVALASSLSVLFVVVSFPATLAAAAPCENLLPLKLKDATVAIAQSVHEGTFAVPGTKNTVKPAVAFCRVALTLNELGIKRRVLDEYPALHSLHKLAKPAGAGAPALWKPVSFVFRVAVAAAACGILAGMIHWGYHLIVH